MINLQVILVIFVVMGYLVNKFKARLSLLILLAGCWISCQKSVEDNLVTTLDFDLSDAVKMDLADFLDSITITTLQTNDSALLKHPKTLEYVNDMYYINDNQEFVYVFSKEGKFKFSTRKLQGNGPGQYDGCVASFVSNNRLGIFDALRYKFWWYDWKGDKMLDINLTKQVLPAFNCLKIDDDLLLFEDSSSLKFYSIKQNQIIREIPVPYQKGMRITSNSGLREIDGEIYYSSTVPESTLYKLDKCELVLKPVVAFSFGKRNFALDRVQEGQAPSYYRNFMMSDNGYAFVSDKYIMHDFKCCFVINDKRMLFAIYCDSTKESKVYFNVERQKGQLMIPHLCKNNVFYYMCEPSLIDFTVDKALMSASQVKQLEHIKEDDNPVIIKYYFKKLL